MKRTIQSFQVLQALPHLTIQCSILLYCSTPKFKHTAQEAYTFDCLRLLHVVVISHFTPSIFVEKQAQHQYFHVIQWCEKVGKLM